MFEGTTSFNSDLSVQQLVCASYKPLKTSENGSLRRFKIVRASPNRSGTCSAPPFVTHMFFNAAKSEVTTIAVEIVVTLVMRLQQ